MSQNLLPQFQLQELSTSPKLNSIKPIQNNINPNKTHITLNASLINTLQSEIQESSNQRAHEIDNHIQFRNNLTTFEMASSVMNARNHHQRITILKTSENPITTAKE